MYSTNDDIINYNKETQVCYTLELDYKELGQRGGLLINEYALYDLILASPLPNAKSFKRWVTSEVLPHIRKYGYYAEGETLEEELHTIKLGMQKQQDEQKGMILKQDYHDHVINSYQYIINQQQSMINKLINYSNNPFGNSFNPYIEPMKLYSIEDLIDELNCCYGIIISDYTIYTKLANDRYIKYNDVLKYFEPLNNSKVFINPNDMSQIFFSKEFYEELKEYFININSRPLIYD